MNGSADGARTADSVHQLAKMLKNHRSFTHIPCCCKRYGHGLLTGRNLILEPRLAGIPEDQLIVSRVRTDERNRW